MCILCSGSLQLNFYWLKTCQSINEQKLRHWNYIYMIWNRTPKLKKLHCKPLYASVNVGFFCTSFGSWIFPWPLELQYWSKLIPYVNQTCIASKKWKGRIYIYIMLWRKRFAFPKIHNLELGSCRREKRHT